MHIPGGPHLRQKSNGSENTRSMDIRSIRLPKTQRFAARRRVVKGYFGDVQSMAVFFGSLRRTFRFDGACIRRPRLHGPVVASLSLSDTGFVTLQL